MATRGPPASITLRHSRETGRGPVGGWVYPPDAAGRGPGRGMAAPSLAEGWGPGCPSAQRRMSLAHSMSLVGHITDLEKGERPHPVAH